MRIPSRSDCHHINPALAHKQATESMYTLASIATGQPGDIDLYLLLKKRSEQSLSDKPSEEDSAQPAAEENSGKAVQE